MRGMSLGSTLSGELRLPFNHDVAMDDADRSSASDAPAPSQTVEAEVSAPAIMPSA